MKLKRIIVLILAFALTGTAGALADEAVEMYKGSKVKVVVNGKALDAPGILLTVDGVSKTMLPSRDIADILQAIVHWDNATQTVSIFKPNVHIALTTPNKDGSYGVFGTVYVRNNYDFFIFAQMDNLTKNIKGIKFEITDPYGKVVFENEQELTVDQGGMKWLRQPVSMSFDYLGDYKAKVYLKSDAEDKFFLVSEKVLESKQK